MRKKNKEIFNGVNYKLFKNILIAVVIFVSLFLVSATIVLAQDTSAKEGSVSDLLYKAGEAAKYNVADVESETISSATVVGDIIQIFLSLLGAIFIILMLYGGYIWMTAAGNSEQIDKAKGLLKDAIIGLIIIVAAYAISYFVLFMIAKDYFESSGF